MLEVVKNGQNRRCQKGVKKVLFFVIFVISMCVDDVMKLMLRYNVYDDVIKLITT